MCCYAAKQAAEVAVNEVVLREGRGEMEKVRRPSQRRQQARKRGIKRARRRAVQRRAREEKSG